MALMLTQAAMIGFAFGLILGLGLAFALLAPLATRWERTAKRLMKMKGIGGWENDNAKI